MVQGPKLDPHHEPTRLNGRSAPDPTPVQPEAPRGAKPRVDLGLRAPVQLDPLHLVLEEAEGEAEVVAVRVPLDSVGPDPLALVLLGVRVWLPRRNPIPSWKLGTKGV